MIYNQALSKGMKVIKNRTYKTQTSIRQVITIDYEIECLFKVFKRLSILSNNKKCYITAEAEQSRQLPVEDKEKDKKQEKPGCKTKIE